MARARAELEMNPVIYQAGRSRRNGGPIREIAKRAFIEFGKYWWDQILPKHFKWIWMAKYRQTPRSPAYDRAKERKFGHRDPMVYSGKTRDALLGSRPYFKSREGSSLRVTLVFPRVNTTRRARRADGKSAVNPMSYWRGQHATRSGRRFDFEKELTTITANELKLGAEYVDGVSRRDMASVFVKGRQRLTKKVFTA